MEQKKVKCTKCGKEFPQEQLKKIKETYLCKQCQKKRRNKWLIPLCIFCITGIGIGIYYKLQHKPMNGFDEVGAINDEMNIDVTFDIHDVTACSNPSLGNPIDNIEEFNRIYNHNLAEAEAQQAAEIALPSIFTTFTINSDYISEPAKRLIHTYAQIYNQTNQKARILVEGFGCNLGSIKGNLVISEKRAESIKNLLVQEGVSKEMIDVAYYGKNRNREFHYPTNDEYRRVIVSIK